MRWPADQKWQIWGMCISNRSVLWPTDIFFWFIYNRIQIKSTSPHPKYRYEIRKAALRAFGHRKDMKRLKSSRGGIWKAFRAWNMPAGASEAIPRHRIERGGGVQHGCIDFLVAMKGKPVLSNARKTQTITTDGSGRDAFCKLRVL